MPGGGDPANGGGICGNPGGGGMLENDKLSCAMGIWMHGLTLVGAAFRGEERGVDLGNLGAELRA